MSKELDELMEEFKEIIKDYKERNSIIKKIEGKVVLISNDHFCFIKDVIQGYRYLGIAQGKLSLAGFKKEVEEINALIEDSLSVLD